MTLLLLPGLDGTGDLFANFVSVLPKNIEPRIIRYPGDRPLGYAELFHHAMLAVPGNGPFALLAESFSTPLAIKIAATRPPNLQGLIICAGFIRSPATWSAPLLRTFGKPFFFRFSLPRFAIERFLTGSKPPRELLESVRHAVRSVSPDVIALRIREVIGCDATEELREVQIPTLYLQAGLDRLVGKSCFEEIQRIKPDTIFASIAGPHLILQREPRKAAQLVVYFLESLTE